MFGELNEAAQPKTSLAKYSIEFNELAVHTRPHRIPFLRLLGRPYTLLYVDRLVSSVTFESPEYNQRNFTKNFEEIVFAHKR